VLQGCGARIEHSRHGAAHHAAEHSEPPAAAARRHEREATVPPTTTGNTFLKSPAEMTLSQSRSPACPGFILKDTHGTVRVLRSQPGESPAVLCPSDYEYRGPRIECGWVDQLCEVQGPYDTVTPDLCIVEYNLTREGEGLITWPRGVTPRLVSTTRSPGKAVEYNHGRRNTSALPVVIPRESIKCEREGYVDLDFTHAKIEVTQPPFTEDIPWSKTFKEITSADGRKVDLRVTQVGSPDAPGNIWHDGNSSADGRINVEGWGAADLRFTFVESGTLRPVVLKKFFFTVFDLRDRKVESRGKEVTASTMQEYYISRRTQIKVSKAEGDSYVFSGAGGSSRGLVNTQDEGVSDSVVDMWLASLERTVVLMFRNTANFSLRVQAVPEPDGQVFEFAGWSELVDMGARVETLVRSEKGGREVVIRDALSDEPVTAEVTDEVTDAFFQPTAASAGVALAANWKPHRWAWVEAAAAAAISAVVVAGGVTACARHWWRRRLDGPPDACRSDGCEAGGPPQALLEFMAAE